MLFHPCRMLLESLNRRCVEGKKTNIGRIVKALFFKISKLITG